MKHCAPQGIGALSYWSATPRSRQVRWCQWRRASPRATMRDVFCAAHAYVDGKGSGRVALTCGGDKLASIEALKA